jgi:ABC-type antimicrobial peptide transport system permease subunit
MRATKTHLAATGIEVLDIELARITSGDNPRDYLRFLEAGAELGARHVITQLPDADFNRKADRFAELCDLARPLGLTIDLEFPSWTETPNLTEATRVLRAAVLTVWARGHLEVARAMGAPQWRLLARHASYVIGPLLIPVFVRAAMRAVLYDATLSFLGLGDPATASWGTTLYWAQTSGAFLTGSWLWWAVPPGAAITVTVVGFALVGVAIEDRINPALKEDGR